MKGERKRITIAIAIERIWDILVGSRGSSNKVLFNLFKFISYQRMVCADPNCGIYSLIIQMCVKSRVGSAKTILWYDMNLNK